MAEKKTKAEEKLEKEQAEALGAGRVEEHDRVDKPAPKQEKGEPVAQDTPSALALAKVGPDGDGEAYAAEKRKHRWG